MLDWTPGPGAGNLRSGEQAVIQACDIMNGEIVILALFGQTPQPVGEDIRVFRIAGGAVTLRQGNATHAVGSVSRRP